MTKPGISIAVPVYNGAPMIKEALDCLAQQTYGDFQVFISDNGSTDGTSEICARFAANDSRFIHHRHEETSDPTTNFLFARDHSPPSELFMWRAHDDLSSLDFVEKLVALFEEGRVVDLAVGSIESHKPKDGVTRIKRRKAWAAATGSASPIALAIRLLHLHESSFYGLWRRQALIDTFDPLWAIYPHGWASDHLTLLPLLLDDRIRIAPSAWFIQRHKPRPVSEGNREDIRNQESELLRHKLARREEAEKIFDNEVSSRRWTPLQRFVLACVKEPYLNKRVVRKKRL